MMNSTLWVASEVSSEQSEIKKKERKLDSSWLIDEEIYPSGWKYRMGKNGVNKPEIARIVTHTGEFIRGNMAALTYMEKNNYSDEDKEKLKTHIQKCKAEKKTLL